MAWLPFASILVAVTVLAVLYSRTVGHIHRMVHMLDEAIGIHEQRLDTHGEALTEVAEILEVISKNLKAEIELTRLDEN